MNGKLGLTSEYLGKSIVMDFRERFLNGLDQ